MRLSTVNKNLKKIDPTAELVRAENGQYFYFETMRYLNAKLPSTEMMVFEPRLNDVSLERWLEIFVEYCTEHEDALRKRGCERTIEKLNGLQVLQNVTNLSFQS